MGQGGLHRGNGIAVSLAKGIGGKGAGQGQNAVLRHEGAKQEPSTPGSHGGGPVKTLVIYGVCDGDDDFSVLFSNGIFHKKAPFIW